jgi:hypothetical protein
LKPADWHNHKTKHVGAASFHLRRKYQAALLKVLDGRVEKAEHARLAQLEFRDDEMPLFDEVLELIAQDG